MAKSFKSVINNNEFNLKEEKTLWLGLLPLLVSDRNWNWKSV